MVRVNADGDSIASYSLLNEVPCVGDDMSNSHRISSPLPDHVFCSPDGEFWGELFPHQGSLVGGRTPGVLGSPVQVVLVHWYALVFGRDQIKYEVKIKWILAKTMQVSHSKLSKVMTLTKEKMLYALL